jgi:hypothetical protein
VTLLSVALLVPSLFWDKGPQSAPELLRSGVTSIVASPEIAATWKNQPAVRVTAADPASFEKLPTPGISFRSDVASATREPWVDSDGWHYLRRPDGRFLYDVPGPTADLAAAEAFTFGGQAAIKTDGAGLPSLAKMLKFLAGIQDEQLRPVVNIAFVDDGSTRSAECLNLLIRRNLLVQASKSPVSTSTLLPVVLGSADYPTKDASNPVVFAQQVREHLTDGKRSLRIYGSDVVIGRLASNGGKTRVYLLNYGTGKYSVDGIRVRVLGRYSKAQVFDPESSSSKLIDTLFDSESAEFTLPKLKTFAVVDLDM